MAIFTYNAFLEDRSRKKALKAIDSFVKHNPLGEIFDPSERGPFSSDEEFVNALREYILRGDIPTRNMLMRCDFVTIRDRILDFKPPRRPRPKKETVKKISVWSDRGRFGCSLVDTR